jgi:hypothetical protein
MLVIYQESLHGTWSTKYKKFSHTFKKCSIYIVCFYIFISFIFIILSFTFSLLVNIIYLTYRMFCLATHFDEPCCPNVSFVVPENDPLKGDTCWICVCGNKVVT